MNQWEKALLLRGPLKRNKPSRPIDLERMMTNEYIMRHDYYRRVRGSNRGIVLDDELIRVLRSSAITVNMRGLKDGFKKEEGAFIQRMYLNQDGKIFHFSLIYLKVDGVLEKCIDFRDRR